MEHILMPEHFFFEACGTSGRLLNAMSAPGKQLQ